MKIAVLQFAPQLGQIQENLEQADKLLTEAKAAGRLDDVQLIIGPELAFTGKSIHLPPWSTSCIQALMN